MIISKLMTDNFVTCFFSNVCYNLNKNVCVSIVLIIISTDLQYVFVVNRLTHCVY